MKRKFFFLLTLAAISIGGARAGVVGTFTSGGFSSGTFSGALGQSVIGRSSDATLQSGIITAALDVDQTGPTYVVNVTNDNNGACTESDCSLREAILASNATTSVDDTINFNIPGAAPHVINLGSNLPSMTDTVTINGLSEPDIAGGTCPLDNPANDDLAIQLNDSNNVSGGLSIASSAVGSIIRGLSITGFGAAGAVQAQGGTTMTCNYLGVAADGTTPGANEFGIVIFSASNVVIGGPNPGDGNLIANQNQDGVVLFVNTNNDVVRGNIIRNNGQDGIRVDTGTGHQLRANRIYSNGSGAGDLGIELQDNGVTANDTGDGDDGPNNQQNFPVLTSLATGGGNSTISGTLNSSAGQTYTIDFYDNDVAEPGNHGEGKTHIGSTSVTTDGSGDATFSQTLTGMTLTPGHFITATATRTSASDGSGALGDTSEFSLARRVTAAPVIATNTGLTVTAGATATITAAQLEATDPDNDTPLTYTVTSAPAHGTLKLNNTATSSFTQADIAAGNVTYTHEGAVAGSDGFGFSVSDGQGGSVTGTFAITITEALSLIVTTTGDMTDNTDNLTSLREAIAYANSNADASTITFELPGAGPHVVQLQNVLPDLSTDIVMDGPTDESVTVRGEGSADPYRIFHMLQGATVIISDLTITNGAESGIGGGLFNNGTLSIGNSTITGNSASSGAGIGNGGTLFLSNTTISGNTASSGGGGIHNDSGPMMAINVTITANTASDSGGIYNDGGQVHLTNSIVAGNSGGNLSAGLVLTTNNHNVLTGDAKLAPLANNGGPTQTHALLYGSPALNSGDNAAATATDQRGLPRSVGFTDIGAFEVQTTYSISGYIRTSNLAPVPNVSVQLSTASGNAGTPVLTDANGFYEITGVPSGGYVVTPGKTGWTFVQPSSYLNVTTAGRGANFIATRTAATYSISGRVATSDGAALPGVSVALTPTKGGVFNPVITNSAGYFTFSGLPDGGYIVTPTKSGHTFVPVNRSITVNGANVTGQNFLGMNGHKIIGRIMTSNGAAISGVTVTRSGAGATPVTTNSAGYYTFINVPDGNITVTPNKGGYTFTPSSKEVAMSGADVVNQNFVGATGYSISGRIATSNGTGIAGATVTLDGGATATTNSAGYYTFYNVANGSHTLVPGKAGTTFIPADKTVNVSNANLSGQNFTGTSS